MNKLQAEYLAKNIMTLFDGKNIVTCATKPDDRAPSVLVNQRIKSVTAHEYTDGNDRWFLCLNDTYGVVTGEWWTINPNNRSLVLKEKNAYGELLFFSWQYQDEEDLRGSYQAFYDCYEGIPK